MIDKAALCKRIFSNMLRVAGKRAGGGPVDLRSVIEEMMPIFESQTAASRRPARARHPRRPALRALLQASPRARALEPGHQRDRGDGPARGRVIIRGRAGDGDGGVELSVVDDGPGIDPEHLAKVVEPFFTTKPNGTGLGLSLVRSLVWQNDGDLEIGSAPGTGTEVRLRLAGAGDAAAAKPSA